MSSSTMRFTKLHYYLIPIVSAVVWWGMLIALLACWGAQGHPIYSFMTQYQDPVYLSDIAATNLQPLFISCVAFQMIFFMGTVIMGYVLRRRRILQPYVSKHQPRLAIASIIFSFIGEIGILLVSIFKTTKYEHFHLTMVGVFIVFIFLSCVCDFSITFIFGNCSSRLHPNHEKVVFGPGRWSNLYMVSFFVKLFWVICAVVFAIAFGVLMSSNHLSTSAVFEWTICFWYGILLLLWSIDLFPSAIKSYRVRHPEEFDDQFIDNHKVAVDSSNPSDGKQNESDLTVTA